MLLPSQQGVFRNIISDTSYAVKAEVTSLKDLGKFALEWIYSNYLISRFVFLVTYSFMYFHFISETNNHIC